MSRSSPYRSGGGGGGGGGSGGGLGGSGLGGGHSSGVSSPVPQFHHYTGRAELDPSAGFSPPPAPGASSHTLKKQKERSETARSVLSAMSWRFLTESTLSDRDYVPPPVLTREGRMYAEQVERQREREQQQQHSPAASHSRAGYSTPDSAPSGGGGGNGTPPTSTPAPAPSHSLLTHLVSSPASTQMHSAYYSPPVAPSPLRTGAGLFNSPSSSQSAAAAAATAAQEQAAPGSGSLGRSGSTGTLGAAGAAMMRMVGSASTSSLSSPSRPAKLFRADSPLKRQARQQARDAKSALLQRMFPVDPLLSPPGLRNPLPFVPPRLTASMLNITNEAQVRDPSLPMVGSDEAAVAEVPRRMDASYADLEQAIIDMAEKSIRDSKAVPLPRPTPERKQRARQQRQQQEQRQHDAKPKRVLRIDTGEEEEEHHDADQLATTTGAKGEEEKQQQHDQQYLGALASQLSNQSGRSGASRHPDSESDYSDDDDLSSWSEEEDEDAPEQEAKVEEVERMQRIDHAGVVGANSEPVATHNPENEGSVASAGGEAPGAGDVHAEEPALTPASAAADAVDAPAPLAAASAAANDSDNDNIDSADGTDATASDHEASLHIEVAAPPDVASDLPASAPASATATPERTPSLLNAAAGAEGESVGVHIEEFKQQQPPSLPESHRTPEQRKTRKARPRLNVVAFADGHDKMSPLSPDFVPSRPASAGGSVSSMAARAVLPAPVPAPALASSGTGAGGTAALMITPESYADPRARFEADHALLLSHAARIVEKEVSFSYVTQQASKVAAAKAQRLVAQNEAHLEHLLDVERRVGAPVSRARARETELAREQKRRAALASRPEFKFVTEADSDAATASAAAVAREQSFAGLSSPAGAAPNASQDGGGALLSPAAQRRKDAEARRAQAALRRAAASPGPHNPLPLFKPTHTRPLAYDPSSGSSFARGSVSSSSPPREKKKLGAWYLPPTQWKAEPALKNNEEATEAEERDEAARAALAASALSSLPRALQEKQQALAEAIPTLFISSVYKAHLEGVARAQAEREAAAAREQQAREAQLAQKAAYNWNRGKLPAAAAAAAALVATAARFKQLAVAAAASASASASASAQAIPSLAHSSSAPSLARPLRGGAAGGGGVPRAGSPAPVFSLSTAPAVSGPTPAASAAQTEFLARTPVRMPAYLSPLIPLDPSHPDTVIVDFAPGTNSLAAIQPPPLPGSGASHARKVGGAGFGGGGAGASRSPWHAKNAPQPEEPFLSTPPNPNVAILQARAAAVAEAAAARAAGDANSPAARLTAMTLSQQSKQREKIDRTPSPNKATARGDESTPEGGRGSPSPKHAQRRSPSPSKRSPSPSHARHRSTLSIPDTFVSNHSASVAEALLRESHSIGSGGHDAAHVAISVEDAEEQALLEAAAAHRRRATAARSGPLGGVSVQFTGGAPRGSGPGSRRSSGVLTSPSLSPSDSGGTTRCGSASDTAHAAGGDSGAGAGAGKLGSPSRRVAARVFQPHMRPQSFGSQKSKAARQSVSAREAESLHIPGLEVHHHSHVFLPNITLTAAQNNKERAAARVSLLSRLHEQASEADAKAAKAKHDNDAAPGASGAVAAAGAGSSAAVSSRSGSGVGVAGAMDLAAQVAASMGPSHSRSDQVEHRDLSADDPEYAHPLEVGMRREPRLIHLPTAGREGQAVKAPRVYEASVAEGEEGEEGEGNAEGWNQDGDAEMADPDDLEHTDGERRNDEEGGGSEGDRDGDLDAQWRDSDGALYSSSRLGSTPLLQQPSTLFVDLSVSSAFDDVGGHRADGGAPSSSAPLRIRGLQSLQSQSGSESAVPLGPAFAPVHPAAMLSQREPDQDNVR